MNEKGYNPKISFSGAEIEWQSQVFYHLLTDDLSIKEAIIAGYLLEIADAGARVEELGKLVKHNHKGATWQLMDRLRDKINVETHPLCGKVEIVTENTESGETVYRLAPVL